jgi:hypothetical protein
LPGPEKGQGPGTRCGKKAKKVTEYGECVYRRKKVLLRHDGRLISHGDDKDGFKCWGSGRSPVGGRAVTELLAKGYRLPGAKVIGGGLPGHGKRA